MAHLWGKSYTRLELLRRVGDMRQLAVVEPIELVDGNQRGVRGVQMSNAAGLSLRVIADRGMGITQLSFAGVPLPFLTAVGTVHPAFTEPAGMGFLRTWPAGFVTPCGLTQVGSPCVDAGEELGIHGRVAGIPARNVAWGGEWQGDEYVVWVEGTVQETRMFGENVVMKRRVWTRLDAPGFWIEDRFENRGFEPVPHMFLQHFNMGFPLVDATTRLELPERTTQPRDEAARPGLDQCCEFSEPVPGYQEQVFYHDLQPDGQGQVEVRLVNPAFDGGRGLGVYWRYPKDDYPVLVEWKQMGESFYVIGIEPANCHVQGRCHEREVGTLKMLQPQEVRTYSMEVGFLREV